MLTKLQITIWGLAFLSLSRWLFQSLFYPSSTTASTLSNDILGKSSSSKVSFSQENPKVAYVGAIMLGLIFIVPAVLLLVYFIVLAVNNGRFPSVPILFAGLFLLAVFAPATDNLVYIKLGLAIAFLTVYQFTTIYLDLNFSYGSYIYTWYAQSGVYLTLNGLMVSFCVLTLKFKYWTISSALPSHRDTILKNVLTAE